MRPGEVAEASLPRASAQGRRATRHSERHPAWPGEGFALLWGPDAPAVRSHHSPPRQAGLPDGAFRFAQEASGPRCNLPLPSPRARLSR